jgi:hypothetical protein
LMHIEAGSARVGTFPSHTPILPRRRAAFNLRLGSP